MATSKQSEQSERKKPEYRQHPISLEAKSTKSVTFHLKDDPRQELEVISSISADDLERLKKLGYVRKSGAKAKGPDDEEDSAS
jgi:hypothetical protein